MIINYTYSLFRTISRLCEWPWYSCHNGRGVYL